MLRVEQTCKANDDLPKMTSLKARPGGAVQMNAPTHDIHGKPFTERDMKLLRLLLRPNGAQRYELNEATMKRVPAA